MMNQAPINTSVSVIMAVKNGGILMKDAIESILNQTHADLEFIVINDGSTDNTLEILKSYNDPRIKIYSQKNQGLAKSLNRGFQLAQGAFLARQDHDDISLPSRLEKQIAFMKANPQCGLLGTAAEIWNLSGPTGRTHDHPTDPGVLAFDLIFNNPFVHTSWMLRREVIEEVGYYTTDPVREPPEDYEYASRVVRKFDVANLPERLVIYREIENSLSSQIRPTSSTAVNTFASRLALISSENLAFFSGKSELNESVINFGAFTHTFYPRIKFPCELRSMQELISSSANGIQDRYGNVNLKTLVEYRQDNLRHQFSMYYENKSRITKLKNRIFRKMRSVLNKLRARL
jgi:glycosyltransferase involved in cell wall biosynthesis